MTNERLFSIADIEQETGISRDTLRIWERRYSFPAPQRNPNSTRAYSREQLERLQLIKQLIDYGMRPGKLARFSISELRELTSQAKGEDQLLNTDVSELLNCLTDGSRSKLAGKLETLLQQYGIKDFLTCVVAPMNYAIGDAWFNGRIGVLDEHYYAEQIRTLLGNVLLRHTPRLNAPKILLTTLPGEQHGLGLMMVGCMLAHEGVEIISLGVQTPLDEIVRGAVENHCSITGISCSSYLGRRTTGSLLVRLRNLLPQTISLWAGGSGVNNLPAMPKGVELFSELRQIPLALRIHEQKKA